MNFGKELPLVLLAFALGCGGRSALDVFGGPPASRGEDATAGVGRVEAGASSSGSGSSSSSSGAGSGSSGSSSGSVSGGGSGSGGSPGCGSPSCHPGGPGMTNCGPSGDDCCCTSLEVAGGTFYRTYANDGSGPAAEADPATVSNFRLDKYLVTVGRFRQFVSAWNAGWLPAAGAGKHTHLNGGLGLTNGMGPGTYESGWVTAEDGNVAPSNANLACRQASTWTPSPGAQENLPLDCVNWWESYAFCIWDGGFLPSEAEWEYAAAGGSQQREYSWGTAVPGTANQYAVYGDGSGHCYYPSGGGCTGMANIAPVGTASLGAGRWGQMDLTGDVYEWILDWSTQYINPCSDSAYLTVPWTVDFAYRVTRGGAFDISMSYLTPWNRALRAPGVRSAVGLRCARNP